MPRDQSRFWCNVDPVGLARIMSGPNSEGGIAQE